MTMEEERRATTSIGEAPEYASADTLLDEALEMTFPASDPIALSPDRLTLARSSQFEPTPATSGKQRGGDQAQQSN